MALAFVAKTSDNTVGGSQSLYLDHGPLASLVQSVNPFGHYTVGSSTSGF